MTLENQSKCPRISEWHPRLGNPLIYTSLSSRHSINTPYLHTTQLTAPYLCATRNSSPMTHDKRKSTIIIFQQTYAYHHRHLRHISNQPLSPSSLVVLGHQDTPNWPPPPLLLHYSAATTESQVRNLYDACLVVILIYLFFNSFLIL